MNNLHENITEVLLLIFLIITFLQSGFDKVADWKGNLSWLKGHFSETPLKNTVPLLLGIILIIEVIAGALCAVGVVQFILDGQSNMAIYGTILSCITLLFLLFGQRIAKDYEGAKTIVIYFMPAIFLLYLLANK
ncbi:DoxX family protein [Cellulophaga sp. 20_2_10]|uniref:DoxX family protein n=1 Tax=Cellulophaga sp. 20_2_10 TaxID=2942476 RepID=UPI00201B1159|nr:DoxX family protein [Cellulophaga sp. 20_2_10]MCL5247304.1 DoxX family protein [Cellulophaga sp. 20_2_10]